MFRYDIKDFVFDDLTDSKARHDIFLNVDNTSRTTIIPRTRQIESARDRFTRASEKATRVPRSHRLDLTNRPSSFDAAVTQVPDRLTNLGNFRDPSLYKNQIEVSPTEHHYHPPQEHDPHDPHKPRSRYL